MVNSHVLLVTFPGQGHINPSLEFAKRITKHGVKLTFLTSVSAIRRMTDTSSFNPLIDFLPFSDGYDDGGGKVTDEDFISALRIHGSKAVEDAVGDKLSEGRPYTRVIFTLFVPWAGEVAQRLRVPITLLWIQPATLFAIYLYYFNNYLDLTANDVINLPGIPRLHHSELPSILQAASHGGNDFILSCLRQNFEILDREDRRPAVLVNTFHALEPEVLRVVNKYKLMAIGPLIPSSIFDGNDSSDRGCLIQSKVDYIQWLENREKSSVIYVAFGSYSVLSKPQMEEIAKGLIKSRKPFLWVIRGTKLDDIISCREELEKQGKVVPWCTQSEVLSHPSVGCFVTHCGWNSTIESLVAGVPFVLFPQWTDQPTNAKLVQDVWGCGVRVAAPPKNGGIVEGDEMKRCIEVVMNGGERGEGVRREAKKWRDLAKEEMEKDGGDTNVNLKVFIDQIIGGQQSSYST